MKVVGGKYGGYSGNGRKGERWEVTGGNARRWPAERREVIGGTAGRRNGGR